MFLDWREEKDRKNQRKHGIDFETAQLVFQDPYALMEPERIVRGEQRFVTLGLVLGQILIVAHTYDQESDRESAHIISARKASRHERKRYENQAY
ncbi:MAG TPA: BrnT family toxin [Terriglobia bacterium]|nr:BrnT family toxin [Terriglobia bacterium]